MQTMPKMIYGTAWKAERTAALVEKAVLQGFRGIDTACQPKHYHEPGVGEALKSLAALGVGRDQLFLQTKFTPLRGQDPKNIPYDPRAKLAEQVRQSFVVSLKNLGTDYIDSLVLHSPLANLEETLEVWRTMEELQKTGGVKALGISNCYDLEFFSQLYNAAAVKPAVVQNRFYEASGFDMELRAFCLEKAITYQSFWTLTANPKLLAHGAIGRIAEKVGKTPAQVLFRFLIQCGVHPLTGTTSQQHMIEDLEVVQFSLAKEEVQQIQRVLEERLAESSPS